MKVGTDGVLLGAWTEPGNSEEILDIGAGTGLVSLMLAQRSNANVTAVEIDPEAAVECRLNVSNSPWSQRISVFQDSVQNVKFKNKFDLIVSNPPFFSSFNDEMSDSRMNARHTSTLDYKTLLLLSKSLLGDRGKCCFVIPYDEEDNFLKTAKNIGLFPVRTTRVKGKPEGKIRRSLVELTSQSGINEEDELIIELERHKYTSEFTELVKEYYLHL
jgi:tRNA1Val (adenine37-N6)-methyltransferase